MGRSTAAIARRRIAWRAWRRSPAGRAYMAAWRAAHRDVERARKARWAAGRRDSSAPLPPAHIGHPIFDQVRDLVPQRTEGRVLRFPYELVDEDARSEAALALLEGRDPLRAIAAVRRNERLWGVLTVPLSSWRAA